MLKKKIFRTLKVYKIQFFSIFFMIMIGSAVFSGLNSSWFGMESKVNEIYAKTNLADGWIRSRSLDEEELNKIKSLPQINSAELRFDYELKQGDKSIYLRSQNDSNISQFELVSGEEMSSDVDGIWLYDKYANDNNLSVGDEFSMSDGAIAIKKEVKGLIKNPEYLSFSNIDQTSEDTGYGYISPSFIPKTAGFNTIVFKGEIDDKNNFYNDLNQILGESKYIYFGRNELPSFRIINEQVKTARSISIVFSTLICIVAILMVFTTMSRILEKERYQIGVLKALGLSNFRIRLQYVIMIMIVILLASAFGIMSGASTIGQIYLNAQTSRYDIPGAFTQIRLADLLIILSVNFIILIFILSITRTVKNESAAESLLPKKVKIFGGGYFNILTNRVRLPFVGLWNLRDVSRNKVRTIMTIFGVMMSFSIILAGLTLFNSQQNLLKWQYDDLANYSNRLEVNSQNLTETELLAERLNAETSSEVLIENFKSNEILTSQLYIYNIDSKIRFEDYNTEKFFQLRDGEVYVTNVFAKENGLVVGDVFSWRVYGTTKENTSKVYGIIRRPIEQGVIISDKTADNLGLKYVPKYLYTDFDNIENEDIITKIVSNNHQRKQMEERLGSFFVIIILMIVIGGALGLVILYNLGILSYSDHKIIFSTLKVLGYGDSRIFWLICVQNFVLALIGIILGLPIGSKVMPPILIGSTDLDVKITTDISSYILAILIVVMVIGTVNWVIYRKIKKIDMIESLKINE